MTLESGVAIVLKSGGRGEHRPPPPQGPFYGATRGCCAGSATFTSHLQYSWIESRNGVIVTRHGDTARDCSSGIGWIDDTIDP